MPRYAARIDANQPETVKYLRGLGWAVLPLHTIGKGCPDFLASKRMAGIPWSCLVELKDGDKCPSDRKLTPAEQSFSETWKGPLIVALGPEDAAEKLNAEWTHHWLTFGRGRD